MTIVLDRPVTVDRTHGVPTDPFRNCPSWCEQDGDWHHDNGDAMHDSPFVVMPAGDHRCTRHDETNQYADEVWLALERVDEGGRVGEPTLYLAPTSSQPGVGSQEAHLGLDEADALADRIRDMVAQARGAKRAIDLRVGDVIVWNGIEQTVVITLADAECCCCTDCPGSVGIETDVSGEGNWIDETFHPDALIPVPAVTS